jgi:hypothetical protein
VTKGQRDSYWDLLGSNMIKWQSLIHSDRICSAGLSKYTHNTDFDKPFSKLTPKLAFLVFIVTG